MTSSPIRTDDQSRAGLRDLARLLTIQTPWAPERLYMLAKTNRQTRV
jgi:hypothetical protein